jgi:hypothetical protein
MTTVVSADTSDLDDFVDHNQRTTQSLLSLSTTLTHQRHHLLTLGLSGIPDSALHDLADLTTSVSDSGRYASEVSAALKTFGADTGDGLTVVLSQLVDARLDRLGNETWDGFEEDLIERGVTPEQARLLRELLQSNPAAIEQFGVTHGSTAPVGLADLIVEQAELRAATLIDDATRTTGGGRNRVTGVDAERLARAVFFDDIPGDLVPASLIDDALEAQLGSDRFASYEAALLELAQHQQLANLALLGPVDSPPELDTDLQALHAEAVALFDNSHHTTGGRNSRRHLDDAELVYQLQKLAERDPGQAVLMKWALESLLTPTQLADVNRLLATNGNFGEGVGVALDHPSDGAIGAVKGLWNSNFGWWADEWADATTAVTYGLYGMAANQAPGTPSYAQPNLPRDWAQIDEIVELEFELDNVAQQGGADLVVLYEVASLAVGGTTAGLRLIKVGRRWFLRSGDDIVADVTQAVVGDGARLNVPLGRGSTVNNVDRFHPRTLREHLAIEEALQNPASGRPAAGPMGDSRWPAADGWQKLQLTVDPGGRQGPISVHYNYNPLTGEVDDLKIVARRDRAPDPEPDVPRGTPPGATGDTPTG